MDQSVINATGEFLNTQIAALREVIKEKDALILRLQEDNSEKVSALFTVRVERNNLINTIKEYVIESVRDHEMTAGTAEALSEICDFELTKTVTITATVDFEIELEVPFDADADDVANGLEFSVDSFDYSIDDFSVDTRSIQAEDNIS